MDKSITESIVVELSKLLMPIKQLNSPQRIKRLFREIGFDITDLGDADQNLQQLITNLAPLIDIIVGTGGLADLVADLIDASTDEETAAALMALADKIPEVIEVIYTVGPELDTTINNIIPNIPPDAIETLAEKLSRRILEYLLYQYLQNYYQRIYSVFHLLGILEPTQAAGDSYPVNTIHWGRIPLLFSDPMALADAVYQWNTGPDTFDGNKFLARFEMLLRAFMLHGGIYIQDDNIRAQFRRVDPEDNKEIRMPLFQTGVWPDSYMELDLNLCPIPYMAATANDPEKKAGFALYPYFFGKLDIVQEVAENWLLNIGGSVEPKDAGLCIKLRAPHDLELVTELFTENPTENFNGAFEVGLLRTSSPDSMIYIFGTENGSHMALKEAGVKFKASSQTETTELSATLNVKEFTIGINPGNDGDGFIQKLLSGINIKSVSDLGIGISNIQGVYFEGSSALEIMIPTHIDLGVLKIDSATVGVSFEDRSIGLLLASSFSTNLGPLFAGVERMGLTIPFSFPDNGKGNLGPVQIESPKFLPPKGVALSLDVEVLKGGGYLFVDADRGEYAGALELELFEWLSIKAIALITTKMPDGSKGFSLLAIITVEFGPAGIQLGMGFTLLGVGGLLGLNRITKIEPLKDGIRTGAIESVMFPQDVVANAPRIISDLRSFFPPMRDIFLIGPMAKIGYSTPTLISLSLGVIIELPNVTITILGVLKAILPDEKADILRLQVNFIGRIEPSNQLLWFYAELFDSRVLFMTLEGGMGLYVNWGNNTNFVISVGGFHPRYNPPPLPFPDPPRIAINILNEPQARIRIEAYFAVTSNAVMFGARAEMFFGLSDFKLEGHLAFDALFQFDPFFFVISLSFGLSAKVFGVGLFSVSFSGLLEGPTPWHIKGKGKISILFFSISVSFETTWGDSKQTKLEPIVVFPLLEKEFKALTNWEAILPKSSNILVSLRKLGEAETDQLVLHPVGKLRISQRKIPIDFKLDKVGNQRPSDVNRVYVDAAIQGGSLSISETEEKFAIGQFKDLDDSSRLSKPAFEPLESGIEIAVAGEQVKTSQAVKRVIRYETIIIDNNFKRYVKSFFKFLDTGFAILNNFLFGHFLAGNAVTKSELSQHHKKRIQPFEDVIQIQPNQYSVAFNSNNKPTDAATFTSQAKALEYMDEQIQNEPILVNALHVIPNSEVNLAA